MTDNYSDLMSALERYNANRGNTVIIKLSEDMSRHTTFRIGGFADLYLIPQNIPALTEICRIIKENDIKHCFLGNGSNVFFDSDGYNGAVVSMSALSDVKIDGNTVTAEAGASLTALSKLARDNSLTGLEFAYGIPGSIGGAVYMNAGAYGGEIAQILTESTYLNTDTLEICTMRAEEHAFDYRHSAYQGTNKLILGAKFLLSEGNRDEISIAMDDYMSRRISKQPLEYPSAGSTFKRYPGRYTAQMIDECGLKGYTVGGAQVSKKHAGFVINKGGATSSDVLSLIEHIKSEIFKKFGVIIECEVIHVK